MTRRAPHENEQFEHNRTVVHTDAEAPCQDIAREIASLIRKNGAAARMTVLGSATGSPPVRLFRHRVRMHREDRLFIASVIDFNLDGPEIPRLKGLVGRWQPEPSL